MKKELERIDGTDNNIEELKEAIDKSNMDTKTKGEIIEILQLYVDVYVDIDASIQALAKMRMRIPLIYYAAAIYGLGSTLVGIFFTVPIVVICGIGVFLVALVGILEVVYARRKLEK